MVEQTDNILAATGLTESGLAVFGVAISCGLIIIGAALGIALIGAWSSSAIARQPEAGGRIFSAMIIAAALVEGVTFFALLICFLTIFWLRG